jgi:hypothetical protein
MNKRLLIAIANYGDSQLHYLKKMLLTFQTYTYQTEIVIDTTVDLSDLIADINLPITQRFFKPAVGQALPFKHRKYFAEHLSQHDYFLYTENDLDIPQQAIDFIVQQTDHLQKDEIIGLYRYEIDQGVYYLTDHDIKTPLSNFAAWTEHGQSFFAPFVTHSGCYFLNQAQLRHAIASGGYLTNPHTGPYGMLEQGASDIYTQCGFKQKFLPLPIDPVLIHHMPDKYINMPTALPRFSIDALSVFMKKMGLKPKLKRMYPPNFLQRTYKKLRYEIKMFESKIRNGLKAKAKSQ